MVDWAGSAKSFKDLYLMYQFLKNENGEVFYGYSNEENLEGLESVGIYLEEDKVEIILSPSDAPDYNIYGKTSKEIVTEFQKLDDLLENFKKLDQNATLKEVDYRPEIHYIRVRNEEEQGWVKDLQELYRELKEFEKKKDLKGAKNFANHWSAKTAAKDAISL